VSELSIQNSDGLQIQSVDDWFRLAPPQKGEKQWKDGRSAKELAKAWFRGGTAAVPSEVAALFQRHPDTRGIRVERCVAEKVTKLDNFRGTHRHHDLVLHGQGAMGRIVAGIEAKADEPFGLTIRERLARARPGSNLPQRICMLAGSVFGRAVDSTIEPLRYQLLHGFAGTLIEAKDCGAAVAVFIIHEFHSDKCDPAKVRQNAEDYERFVRALKAQPTPQGELTGPITVPGGRYVPACGIQTGNIRAFIGRAVSDCRTAGTQRNA